MRKIISLVILVPFVLITAIFFVLLNLRLTILDSSNLKSLASRSGVYEFIAGTVREGLIRGGGEEAANSPFFEVVVEAVDAPIIKTVSESTIDQFFVVLSNPTKNQFVTVPLSKIGNQIAKQAEASLGIAVDSTFDDDSVIGRDRTINLGANKFVTVLSRSGSVIAGIGLIALFLLVLLFVLSSSHMNARFLWAGWSILLVSFILVALWIVPNVLSARLLDQIFAYFQVGDPKLVTGIRKFYSVVIGQQSLCLGVEAISMFFSGLLFIIFGRNLKENKIEFLKR